MCVCFPRIEPRARQQAALGTWASTPGGHAAEAEERDADGRGVAGAGGEATGGHTHVFTLCVHNRVKRSFGVSLRYCRIQWCDKTRLSRYAGHSLLLFSHSQKDTSVWVGIFPPAQCCTCTFVCRTRSCDRAPTSRYVGAFAFMLSQDGLWPATFLFICSSDYCLFYSLSLTKSPLKKVSVAQCTWNP